MSGVVMVVYRYSEGKKMQERGRERVGEKSQRTDQKDCWGDREVRRVYLLQEGGVGQELDRRVGLLGSLWLEELDLVYVGDGAKADEGGRGDCRLHTNEANAAR
jgi:hypothetical protein